MPYINRLAIRNHVAGIPDMRIDLRREGDRPRHLILTGPNGSGKTTTLREIVNAIDVDTGLEGDSAVDYLRRRSDVQAGILERLEHPPHLTGATLDREDLVEYPLRVGGPFLVSLEWTERTALRDDSTAGRFISAWLPDNRMWPMAPTTGAFEEFVIPVTSPSQRVGDLFHRYLLNEFIRAKLIGDRRPDEAARRMAHVEACQQDLRVLFEYDDLVLDYDDEHWRFVLQTGGRRFSWNQLAAGHRSALMMMAELGLRIDAGSAGLSREDPRLSGVAVIDEMALHLHPSMQEKILPFLIKRFPRIQFIVATHSPAIISSVDGALVVDLWPSPGGPRRAPVESETLRGVPYGDLMVNHFGIDSDFDLESTEQLAELDALAQLDAPTPAQAARLEALATRLARTSHPLGREVYNRILLARLERQEQAT